ncbi:MAG: hypothetical protein SGPRY_012150, partial [Prymnesium sp.]
MAPAAASRMVRHALGRQAAADKRPPRSDGACISSAALSLQQLQGFDAFFTRALELGLLSEAEFDRLTDQIAGGSCGERGILDEWRLKLSVKRDTTSSSLHRVASGRRTDHKGKYKSHAAIGQAGRDRVVIQGSANAKIAAAASTTKLDLSNRPLGNALAAVLLPLIRANPDLRILNLSQSSIQTGRSLQVLAESLKIALALLELNLSGNGLRCPGLVALAPALSEHPTLVCLNLAENELGPSGATTMADILSRSSTIMDLNLAANALSFQGANALGAHISRPNC